MLLGLQRYTFKEIFRAFLLSFSVLTVMLSMGSCFQLAYRGLSVMPLIRAIPHAVLFSIPFSLPMSLLTSLMIGCGRLAEDNEIVTVRAAGIHPVRLVHPLFLFAVLLCAITIFLQDEVLPRAKKEIESLLMFSLSDVRNVQARLGQPTIATPECRIFMIDKYDSHCQGMVMLYPGRGKQRGEITRKIFAPKAEIMDFDFETRKLEIVLFNGNMIEYKKSGAQVTNFVEQRQTIHVAVRKHKELETRLAYKTTSTIQRELKAGLIPKRKIRRALSLWHQRKALSFACLVFLFLGIPLGLASRQVSIFRGLGISVGIVLVVYYPLFLVANNLAGEGLIPVVLGGWLANAVMIVLGCFLYRRYARELL